MVNMTLSLPESLVQSLRKHAEINWSEVARDAFRKKLRDLELMDKLTAKSRLTMEDVMGLDEVVKKGAWEMHKELVR